jgi:hypothetical protein
MKKIAVNTVKAFLKEHADTGTVTKEFPVADSTFEVQIRTILTVDEKTKFISRVVRNCFDAAGNYHPEFLTPMLRATILQMCTNVPVLTMKGEAENMDLDAMNALYQAMNLDYLDNEPYQAMMREMVGLCQVGIEWRKARNLSDGNKVSVNAMNALGDAAISIRNVMEALAKKADSADMDTLMQYAGKISKATENLDEGGILQGILDAQIK